MKSLTWFNVNGASIFLVELLKKMPVLESLHWGPSEDGDFDLSSK